MQESLWILFPQASQLPLRLQLFRHQPRHPLGRGGRGHRLQDIRGQDGLNADTGNGVVSEGRRRWVQNYSDSAVILIIWTNAKEKMQQASVWSIHQIIQYSRYYFANEENLCSSQPLPNDPSSRIQPRGELLQRANTMGKPGRLPWGGGSLHQQTMSVNRSERSLCTDSMAQKMYNTYRIKKDIKCKKEE